MTCYITSHITSRDINYVTFHHMYLYNLQLNVQQVLVVIVVAVVVIVIVM